MGDSVAVAYATGRTQKNNLFCQGIPPNKVSEVWPLIADKVSDLLDRSWGEFQSQDVLELLEKSDWQLWLFGIVDERIDLLVITQVLQTPQLRYGQIWGMEGENLDKYLPFLDNVLIPWFRSKHCSFVEVVGRPGLERKLRSWTRTGIVLRTPL